MHPNTGFDLLHIVTLNSQGLRDRLKPLRCKQWIIQQKVDIVFLQETHFTEDILPFYVLI